MVRLFIDNGSGTYSLLREIPVPQTEQSAYEPSYKHVLELNYNLQSSYKLGVSTQNGELFAVTVEGEQWSYPI